MFLPARSGYSGQTFPADRRIEVYVRPEDSAHAVAYTLAHELGHAVDIMFSTPEARRAYLNIRGIAPSTRWFGCGGCSDLSTPAGDFAETFGFIVTDPGFDWRSTLGGPPGSPQIAAVRALYHF